MRIIGSWVFREYLRTKDMRKAQARETAIVAMRVLQPMTVENARFCNFRAQIPGLQRTDAWKLTTLLRRGKVDACQDV